MRITISGIGTLENCRSGLTVRIGCSPNLWRLVCVAWNCDISDTSWRWPRNSTSREPRHACTRRNHHSASKSGTSKRRWASRCSIAAVVTSR